MWLSCLGWQICNGDWKSGLYDTVCILYKKIILIFHSFLICDLWDWCKSCINYDLWRINISMYSYIFSNSSIPFSLNFIPSSPSTRSFPNSRIPSFRKSRSSNKNKTILHRERVLSVCEREREIEWEERERHEFRNLELAPLVFLGHTPW